MPKVHYTIPLFLPEEACPNRCIFCNQFKITAKGTIPSLDEAESFIKQRLLQIPQNAENIQIAFFGGNFSGLDVNLQSAFLKIAQKFIDNDRVDSIRLSTRPDYINDSILENFSKYSVKNIELGAQSFDNKTLKILERGHTAEQTEKASILIKEFGFNLGLQMMVGLPEEDLNSAIFTANEIVRLKADETRIYPLLVIENTILEKMYNEGAYKPLSLSETIQVLLPLVKIFESNKVKILRIGLHPFDEKEKLSIIDGPYFESLSQMVYTELWFDKLKDVFEAESKSDISIYVSPNHLTNVVGYKQKNKLRSKNPNIKFRVDNSLKNMEYEIAYS